MLPTSKKLCVLQSRELLSRDCASMPWEWVPSNTMGPCVRRPGAVTLRSCDSVGNGVPSITIGPCAKRP